MTKPQVVIIGAGQIGRALARAIGERAEVTFWDKEPSSVPEGIKPLEDIVPKADFVFLCVPSWVTRGVAEQITPLIKKDAIIIALAKGLEQDTLKTMATVLKETLPEGQPYALLGGPLLAEEIQKDLRSVGVFGSVSEDAFKRTEEIFAGSCMRLEYADDPESVALASVLKNIYAVGLGIADGLGLGWNAKGWLARLAIQEMCQIGKSLGGNNEIICGTAGASDFLATSMSPDSHNQQTGKEIGLTGECSRSSEGCRSLVSILTLINNKMDGLKFLQAIDRILQKHESPEVVYQDLFVIK